MAKANSKSAELVEALRGVATLSIAELLGRLRDPEKIGKVKIGELNFLAGTAVDKIAKYENWERKGSSEAGEFVRALVAGLQESTGVHLELTVEKLAEPKPKPIEVIVEPRELPKLGDRHYREQAAKQGQVIRRASEYEDGEITDALVDSGGPL